METRIEQNRKIPIEKIMGYLMFISERYPAIYGLIMVPTLQELFHRAIVLLKAGPSTPDDIQPAVGGKKSDVDDP